jgi:two-component system, NarL family, sensor histidine kinase UhpB
MGLQQRLLLSIGFALLATLLVGSALAFWHAALQVQTEMKAAVAVGEHVVRNAIDHAAQDDQHQNLERLVAEFNGNRHLRAALVDENGSVLVASNLEPPTDQVPDWFKRYLGGPSRRVTVELPSADGSHDAILLITDASNELAEAWSDIGVALTLLAIFSSLVLGLVYWILERGLRPLKGLSDAFGRIGTGDYTTRVEEAGATELVRLARSFNQMVTQLSVMKLQNDRLNEQLASVQEEERTDIARELHDEIGPFLFAVSLDVSAMQRVAKGGTATQLASRIDAVRDAVTHMQRHLRSILGRLRPTVLLDLGLAHAVESLVDFWKVRHPHIDFNVRVCQESFGKLLDDAMYRILREGLSNALRHGRPRCIAIKVWQESERMIAVEIVDDGGGLSAPAPVPGFGITGMQERATSLGGTLTVGNREDGSGVVVTARLPYKVEDHVQTEEIVEELSA